MRRYRRCAGVFLTFAVSAGCAIPDRGEDRGASSDSVAASPHAAEPALPESFSGPVIVFIQAAAEDIEALRAERSPEDFAVIADDMNYYRSLAMESLDRQQIPVVRLTGRRPLMFDINGEARELDLTPYPWLDLLILYTPGREPRVIAALQIDEIDEFFGTAGR